MKQNKTRRVAISRKTRVQAARKSVKTRNTSAKYIAKAKIRAARRVHRRIMLHPITVLFLLFAGIIIVGMTFKSSAATYNVNAKVAAEALTEGASITSPTDGAKFTTSTQNISGTCPDNSYVKLYVNNTFAGVAWCSSNTFQIQVSLYTGQNNLRAQDYNVTDDPGPTTPIVSVTYTQPAPPPPPPPSPPNTVTGSAGSPIGLQDNNGSYALHGNTTPSAPLLLTSDFHYQTFTTGSKFTWSIDLQGGVAPYNVNINWGDGQHDSLIVKQSKTFYIEHTYTEGGYYQIIVKSVDSIGTSRIVQLAALIKKAGAASIFSLHNITGGSSSSTTTEHGWYEWLIVAWPLYIVLLLVAFSFWLGERQEYSKLKNRIATKKRYARR